MHPANLNAATCRDIERAVVLIVASIDDIVRVSALAFASPSLEDLYLTNVVTSDDYGRGCADILVVFAAGLARHLCCRYAFLAALSLL